MPLAKAQTLANYAVKKRHRVLPFSTGIKVVEETWLIFLEPFFELSWTYRKKYVRSIPYYLFFLNLDSIVISITYLFS